MKQNVYLTVRLRMNIAAHEAKSRKTHMSQEFQIHYGFTDEEESA